jgi:hypothetical protein
MTDAAASVGIGLAVSAALLYLVLRFFVANPTATDSTKAISSHALWTAAIAFLASGTSGLTNLWANPDPSYPGETSAPTLIMHAAAPGLWLGVVYILGQFTWPRHLKPVRSASLQVRSVKMAIPKLLAAVLLVCTLLSTMLIIAAWNDAGAPDRVGSADATGIELPIYDGNTDEYGNPIDEDGNMVDLDRPEGYTTGDRAREAANTPYVAPIDGTRPGSIVGPYLLGGLVLALVSVAAVSTLVVRRPPLDALDEHENAVLRSIWINRLLRTAIIVVGGFGAMSLNYLAASVRARGEWVVPIGDPSAWIDATAQEWSNTLGTIGGVGMIVLVIFVLACPPPRLSHVSATAGTRPPGAPSASFSTARDFLLLAQGASIVAVAVLGPIPAWTTESDATRLGELASSVVTLLLAVTGFFLIQALAGYIVSRRLGGEPSPRAPHTYLLPHWFTVVVAVAVTTALASIATFLLKGPPALAAAAWWMLGLLVLAGAGAWVLYRMAATRPALRGAGLGEDRRLRILLAQRGARVFGGVAFVIAGVLAVPSYWTPTSTGFGEGLYADLDPSGFQITCLVLGAALSMLPAATAYRAPRLETRSPSMSNH